MAVHERHEPARVPTLDGIRGLAILGVLVFHFGTFDPRPGIDNLFHKVISGGWAGVDLFFVLSGFLITGLLVDAKGSEHYYRNFYIRRFLRIFPVYYGYLIALFIIVPMLPPRHPDPARSLAAPWFWTYTVNWLIARHGNWAVAVGETGRFWSLSVEEQFYLIWPLLVAVSSRRALLRLTGGLMAAAFVGRCLMLVMHVNSLALMVTTSARVDTLAVGAFLALAVRGEGGASEIMRRTRPIRWLAAGVLAAVVVLCHGPKQQAALMQTLGYSAVAVCCGSLLLAGVTAPSSAMLSRVLTTPMLRTLGKYSYGLYIFFQLPADFLWGKGLTADRVPRVAGSALPGVLLFIAAGTAMSLALAVVSWYTYERHFLALKRFFPASGPPALESVEAMRNPMMSLR